MNAGIKKRLKCSTGALTGAQFLPKPCVNVQAAAGRDSRPCSQVFILTCPSMSGAMGNVGQMAE